MAQVVRNTKPHDDVVIYGPDEYNLSIGPASYPICSTDHLPKAWGNNASDTKVIIKKVLLICTQAPPATPDATYNNILNVGSYASPSLYTTITIPAGVNIGDVIEVDQDDFDGSGSRVIGISSIWGRSSGGASGTGLFRMGLVLSYDYTDWNGFVETVG